MPRTLVKTTTAGWYINAEDPDGKRLRAHDGDNIISLEEFEARKEGAEGAAKAVTESARSGPNAEASKPKADRPAVTLTTGARTTGKTTTIKCKYKDPETGKVCGKERVIKVQDAFQVKYCPEHQKRHRLDLRKAARAVKAKKKGSKQPVAA